MNKFDEILIRVRKFSFKMHLKMSTTKWRPFSFGLNVLITYTIEEEVLQQCTVKPVCNDHLCNKIYYLWFIQ